MDFLIQNADQIIAALKEALAALGALVAAASTLVKLSPSTKDDELLGKLLGFVALFSVFNRKVAKKD